MWWLKKGRFWRWDLGWAGGGGVRKKEEWIEDVDVMLYNVGDGGSS
jgi:hypothetical protein